MGENMREAQKKKYVREIRKRSSIASVGFPKFWIPSPPPCVSKIRTGLEAPVTPKFADVILEQKVTCLALELYSRILGCGRNSSVLLIISSILQQYLLYVSTLPPLPFKVSACHNFGLYPPTPKNRQQCQQFS